MIVVSVDSLNGDPGIHSARVAGKKKDFNQAMRLHHIQKIKKFEVRTCKFVCALSLCWPIHKNITVKRRSLWEICLAQR